MAKSKAKATGAIEILKEQHDKVKKAFKEFEKLERDDTETAQQLVQTVCEDLKLHTTLEEELFYPAVREAIDDEDIMNEAQVEHETAKMLIEQLENMGPDDPNFHATFTVLGYFFGKSWEVIEEYLGWGGLVAFLIGLGAVLWFLHRKREHELEGDDGSDRKESNRD